MAIAKLISGGQTGADRAALDVALVVGIPCGGWCPKGRVAEDGPLPIRYTLQQTPSADYPQRTEWNVRDSDGTLVLAWGPPTGGTALTVEMARRYRKALLVVDLSRPGAETQPVAEWLEREEIRVLNVAGPRESKAPGLYKKSRLFLAEVLRKA